MAVPTCNDVLSPRTKMKKKGVKVKRKRVTLKGSAKDRGEPCAAGLDKVQVSLARVSGRHGVNCRFLKSRTKYQLTEKRNCRRPVLFTAKGTNKWKFSFALKLKPGKYRAQARGLDTLRNKETPKKKRNIVFFRVKKKRK